MLGRVEDPVRGGDRVVVLAEGRGDVDEAGAVLGGDEVAGDAPGSRRGSRSVERRRPGPRSGGRRARAPGSARAISTSSPSTFSTSGSARISVSPSTRARDVGDLGRDGDGDVAGQRPGRRRPDQQRLARLARRPRRAAGSARRSRGPRRPGSRARPRARRARCRSAGSRGRPCGPRRGGSSSQSLRSDHQTDSM